MTAKSLNKKRGTAVFTLLLLFGSFVLTLLFPDRISHSVKSGLSLCANVIIPSVFPFLILSDFLYSFLDFSSLNCIGAAFERIFKINRRGIYPFVLGILCGFPLGVKSATELYKSGSISKQEAERLIGFCNNTGPAFLVCGIGAGLRGDIREGFIIYFSMVVSATLCGILFGIGESSEDSSSGKREHRAFSLTDSIKNAGLNTLNICSYLTFFACIVGMLRTALGENILYLLIIPLLEVGSSSSILSKTKLLSPIASISLTSFATGFSGLSVHMQALSFISQTDLSVNKYFLMKCLQGIISFFLTLLLYILF